jgi:hypothetical protein
VSGKIVKSIVLPDRLGCGMAIVSDPTMSSLYCNGWRNDTVFRFDLTTLSFAGVVSAPGDRGYSALIFDPALDALVYDDYANRTLKAIDPLTGSVVASTPEPSIIAEIVMDPSVGRIYDAGYTYPAGPENFSVLDPRTLHTESEVSGVQHTISWGSPMVDRVHGQIYFHEGVGVVALDESTGRVDGALLNGVAWPYAYDPVRDALVEDSGGPSLVIQSLAHGNTTSVPFALTPIVGTSAPWLITVAGTLAGICLIVVGLRMRARSIWRALDGDGTER